MQGSRTSWMPIVLIVAILAALAGLTWVNYRFSIQNPGGNDFLARWNGAHFWLVEGVSPYDPQVGKAAQQMIYGRPADPSRNEDAALFVYPLFSMVFFGPFGLLDYTLARALWMTLLEVALVLLSVVSLRMAGWKLSSLGVGIVFLASLLWYNGARTIILGQFSGLNALLMAAAVYFIWRGYDFGPGILLALSLSKPQMSFLLAPFVLLWALSVKRYRLLLSFLGAFGLLMLATLALIPDWPLQWLRELVAYPEYTGRIGSVVSVVANAMPGIGKPVSLFLYALFGLYLLYEWVRVWGRDANSFLWTAMMTLVVTNIVAPRTATPHYVALLPVVFMLFSAWQERWGRAGRVLEWLLALLLVVGQWALFLATVKGNEEAAVMYLPIPILCLLGLWWVRWWLVRPPKLLYEQLLEIEGRKVQ